MSLCSEEEDGAAKILVFAKPIDNFCASLHYDRIVDHCTRNDSAVLCHSEHPKGTVEASIQLSPVRSEHQLARVSSSRECDIHYKFWSQCNCSFQRGYVRTGWGMLCL